MGSLFVVVFDCFVHVSEVFGEEVVGLPPSFELSVGLGVFDACFDVFYS